MKTIQREESIVEEVRTSWMANNDNFEPQHPSTREFLWREFQRVLPVDADEGSLKTRLRHWFDRLYELQYQPSIRFYHTPVHLEEMLRYYHLIQRTEDVASSSSTVILLAIFFHDAIYDAKSSTNESDSAILFQEFAQDFELEQDLRADVVEYILATRSHDSSNGHEMSMQLKLFLDLDLAVLGKNSTAYQQYARAIRQEYSFVQHDIYCSKRAEILEDFLQKQRLFCTEIFHCALDTQARSNLNREIESLRNGIIPGEGNND